MATNHGVVGATGSYDRQSQRLSITCDAGLGFLDGATIQYVTCDCSYVDQSVWEDQIEALGTCEGWSAVKF